MIFVIAKKYNKLSSSCKAFSWDICNIGFIDSGFVLAKYPKNIPKAPIAINRLKIKNYWIYYLKLMDGRILR